MPRPFTDDRLVIASHNQGKVEEISALLMPFRIAALAAASLGIPEPEETGDSFEANAALKAGAAAQAGGLPALADDSGLVVPALGGAPGIYSARWAGRRAANAASATIRCSCPTAGRRLSAKSSPRKNI